MYRINLEESSISGRPIFKDKFGHLFVLDSGGFYCMVNRNILYDYGVPRKLGKLMVRGLGGAGEPAECYLYDKFVFEQDTLIITIHNLLVGTLRRGLEFDIVLPTIPMVNTIVGINLPKSLQLVVTEFTCRYFGSDTNDMLELYLRENLCDCPSNLKQLLSGY